jgi:hypothetical protein
MTEQEWEKANGQFQQLLERIGDVPQEQHDELRVIVKKIINETPTFTDEQKEHFYNVFSIQLSGFDENVIAQEAKILEEERNKQNDS